MRRKGSTTTHTPTCSPFVGRRHKVKLLDYTRITHVNKPKNAFLKIIGWIHLRAKVGQTQIINVRYWKFPMHGSCNCYLHPPFLHCKPSLPQYSAAVNAAHLRLSDRKPHQTVKRSPNALEHRIKVRAAKRQIRCCRAIIIPKKMWPCLVGKQGTTR